MIQTVALFTRSAAKLLTRDEARRIAANVAKAGGPPAAVECPRSASLIPSVRSPKKIKAGCRCRRTQETEDGKNSDHEEKGSQAIFNGDNARLISDETGEKGFHRTGPP
jgi:hypothetical protein